MFETIQLILVVEPKFTKKTDHERVKECPPLQWERHSTANNDAKKS